MANGGRRLRHQGKLHANLQCGAGSRESLICNSLADARGRVAGSGNLGWSREDSSRSTLSSATSRAQCPHRPRGCAGAIRLQRPYPLRCPRLPLSVPEAPLPLFPNTSSSLEAATVTRVSPRTHTPHARQTHDSLSPRATVHAGLYARSHMITEPQRVRASTRVGRRPRDWPGRCPGWSRGRSFGVGRAELGRVRAAAICATPPSARSLRSQPPRRNPRRSCRCSRRHSLRGRRSGEGSGNA